MDQVTQQNAALVEEMTAAASSLKTQAQDLVQTVAMFKLGAQHGAHTLLVPAT
jgi:methyl-accepting chemotaxis protein